MPIGLPDVCRQQLDIVGHMYFETDGCVMHLCGSGKSISVDIKSQNVSFRLSQLLKYFRLHRGPFLALCAFATEANISMHFTLDDLLVMRIGEGVRGILPSKYTGGSALEIRTLAILRALIRQRIRALRNT